MDTIRFGSATHCVLDKLGALVAPCGHKFRNASPERVMRFMVVTAILTGHFEAHKL